jgi:hypothetical protein
MSNDEKRYIAWLKKIKEKYVPILFLDRHDIHFERKDAGDNYLSSAFRFPYLEGEIFYSSKAIVDWKRNPKQAERRIIHEFFHIITDQLYAIALERFPSKSQLEDAREGLTDHLARIVSKLCI